MAEKFEFRGKSLEELKDISLKDFSKLITARPRRSLSRGLTDLQKRLLEKVKKERAKIDAGKEPKTIRTHCRDMVIVPVMIGLTIAVYNGKEFVDVEMSPDKLGHFLGEFTYNRNRVQHSSPGVGATRGSIFVPTK